MSFVFPASYAQDDPAKTINCGVINGKAVSLVKPEYPAAAKAVGAAGAVNVEVILDEEGNVTSAEATYGHSLLKKAAENAALNAKFQPKIINGKPDKTKGVLVYNFAVKE